MKLSNSSKQALLSVVKDTITSEELYLNYVKTQTKYFYEHSDANNPEETAFYFEKLNEYRNEVRLAKKRIKKLAQTSKELKAELRAGFMDK
jgi:hypothetical protein